VDIIELEVWGLRIKRFGAFISMLVLFLAFTPMSSTAYDPDFVPTGLVWDCLKAIEANLLECSPLESDLPSYVNLKHMFPTPGNQGSLNSCVGWAVAYALKSHQEEVRREWGLHTDKHLFSPYFVWNQLNGGQNRGISIGGAMSLLVDQGVSSIASFPQVTGDYRTQPTPEQRAEAMQFRIASWHTIRGIDNMRRRLADGDGIVIGITIFPDFENLSPANPIFDVVSGNPRGGHAVTLIGYCDYKAAFKLINSWGTNWGVGGYGWISYELMNDTMVNQHGAAVGFIMEPRDSAYWERFFEFTVSDNEATIIDYTGLGSEIVIPDTLGGYLVTAIGDMAFRNNISLTSVVIPDSVIRIGNAAFQNNISLVNVTIGNNVETIGNRAFQNNASLTEVVIPDSVTSIEWDAFAEAGLTNITIPNSVTSIGGGAFRNTLLTNVAIPDSITYLGSRAFFTSTLTYIKVDKNNLNYASIDGVLFNRSLTTLIQYPAARAGAYTIPYGVTVIEDFAFYRSEFLTSVVILDSVISIGMWAFAHCLDLIGVVIPDSITNIGRFAFSNNVSLTYAIIGDGLTYISGYMFAHSPFLNNVVIGSGVTTIGERAFFGCRFLRRINIPDNVTFINWQAFHHNAGDMWFPNYRPLPFLIIYCYDNSFAHNYAISNDIPFVLIEVNAPAPYANIASVAEYNGYIRVTLETYGLLGANIGKVFFAAFNHEGTQIYISEWKHIEVGKEIYDFDMPIVVAAWVRVFVWECSATMSPLSRSINYAWK